MTLSSSAYRFAIAALIPQSSSCSYYCCSSITSSSSSFIGTLPPRDIRMSSKRSSSSGGDKSSTNKKAKQQQSSLTGFFTSTKAKATNDDDDNSSSFKYKIFCDLDGVLCDFDSGVKSLFNGRSPDDLAPGTMWGRISSTPNFYTNLPWTSDGQTLWNTLLEELPPGCAPDILTGVPRNFQSRAQKFEWCRRELVSAETSDHAVNHVDMAGKRYIHEVVSGRKRKNDNVINVITCWSKNKHEESRKNHVLIDDRLALREAWEQNGGIFIHHTSTVRTLEVLRERGIIGCKDGGDE